MHIHNIPHSVNLTPVLVCVTILLIVHLVISKIKRLDCIDISMLNSIAGGIGLGTVFAHLLPDIMVDATKFTTGATHHLTGGFKTLLLLLFLAMLCGFCAMYTLEKLAHDQRSKGQSPANYIYYIHLGVMVCLFFSMVSEFPELSMVSSYSLYIMTTVLVTELVMEDHALIKHFGVRYNLLGRGLVVIAILLGWAYGAFSGPEATITKTFVKAFIIGIILLSVVKTEFDLLEQKSHFPTFLFSISTKVIIVIFLLFLESKYHE